MSKRKEFEVTARFPTGERGGAWEDKAEFSFGHAEFQSIQFSRSVVCDSLRPHDSPRAGPPSITNCRSSLRPASMESATPSSHQCVGFPGKESTCHFRRCRFHPLIGKILWRRKWQPTPVFLPGESHGQRSLVGYSSWR